jgi:hypothetical protein
MELEEALEKVKDELKLKEEINAASLNEHSIQMKKKDQELA